MGVKSGLLACLLALAAATPSLAQNPPSSLSLKDPSSCKQTAKAEPATKPAPASADGTAPGNAGSTGWSGGLGGSQIGTTQNGSTPGSKTYQPAVARGLDPISAPRKAADSC